MSSLLGTVKLEREKLLHAISIKYQHLQLDDLKKLCPFNEDEWIRQNEDMNIKEKEILCDPVIVIQSVKKKRNLTIRPENNGNSCMARIWNNKDSSIQCSKSKNNGDFCNLHSKEMNKECSKCSNYHGTTIIHKYKWEICGRIDQDFTYCFWCSNDNKPPKTVNSKHSREKQARKIFYDMKRVEIKKETGKDIRNTLSQMWRDLTELEKNLYLNMAKQIDVNDDVE